ncbi:MAG: hypothetical protein ACTS27_07290 [Phycisphaerales bacterium]
MAIFGPGDILRADRRSPAMYAPLSSGDAALSPLRRVTIPPASEAGFRRAGRDGPTFISARVAAIGFFFASLPRYCRFVCASARFLDFTLEPLFLKEF